LKFIQKYKSIPDTKENKDLAEDFIKELLSFDGFERA
jgi:hypothetical protein